MIADGWHTDHCSPILIPLQTSPIDNPFILPALFYAAVHKDAE